MKQKLTNLFWRIVQLAILFILAVIVLNLFSGSREDVQIKEKITTHTDTLWLRDTIEIERHVYISKTVIDSILVPVQKIDTVFFRDTLYIQLPREQKHYHQEEYDVWISGFQPELDSLKLYTNEALIMNQYEHRTQIMTEKKRKRFGIGVQVGYGVTLSNQPQLFPYIGIGLSYDLISF